MKKYVSTKQKILEDRAEFLSKAQHFAQDPLSSFMSDYSPEILTLAPLQSHLSDIAFNFDLFAPELPSDSLSYWGRVFFSDLHSQTMRRYIWNLTKKNSYPVSFKLFRTDEYKNTYELWRRAAESRRDIKYFICSNFDGAMLEKFIQARELAPITLKSPRLSPLRLRCADFFTPFTSHLNPNLDHFIEQSLYELKINEERIAISRAVERDSIASTTPHRISSRLKL